MDTEHNLLKNWGHCKGGVESILGRKGDYDSTDNNIELIVTTAKRTTEV